MRKRRSPLPIRLVGLIILSVLVLYVYWMKTNDQQTIHYETVSGPLVNPMMGLAPWATLVNTQQPHTLVYADLTWREFEPKEGVFDFTFFEKSRYLAHWRAEGQRVVFRFVTDRPGGESHLDIPDWLFEKIDRDGEFYDNEYGKGFSPNYSNPIFIEYHRLAIQALGDRYGNDDFFVFIELGSLGHWGEWHTYPDLKPLPIESIRNSYVLQYVAAFPNAYLLMRRPFAIAYQLNLGLYNDMTADVPATREWLGWIKNGGAYPSQEKNSLIPMPNGWQQAPIGGEQAPALTNELIYGTELEQTLNLLRASHTTFIGPGGPYNVTHNGSLQSGLDQALSIIGYRIYIDHVQMPSVIRLGNKLDIQFVFSNDGIAPFYSNWPSRIFIFDQNGNVIETYPIDLELPEILPGVFHYAEANIPINNLENGSYGIGLAILDPLTNQPSVKFANRNPRNDLIQDIGSFEVRHFLGFLYSLIQ